MAKLTLSDLTNLKNPSAVTTVNNNNTAIENAFENTVSRDGTSPNQMEADLDMNSNRILNLPDGVTGGEPFTVRQAELVAIGTGTEVLDGDKGDITVSALGTSWSIDASAVVTSKIADDNVTNAKLANVATATFKGRNTAGTGDPEDLTVTQATALLNNFVGDSGSGGTKGLVPAPAAGDAAADKFLKADGTWEAPVSSTNTLTEDDFPAANDVNLVAIRTRLRVGPDIFDYVPGGGVPTDWTDTFLAMEAASHNSGGNLIRTCYIPYDPGVGYYTVDSADPIQIRSGLVLKGDHSSQSQIKFTEPFGGLLWDGSNFGGGGLHHIGLVMDLGATNGSNPLRIGGGNPTNSPNQFVLHDVLVTSLGSTTMSYCVLFDGTAFPGSAGGLRAPYISDLKTFNATASQIELRYVRGGVFNGINTFVGGGTSGIIQITGLADSGLDTRTSVGIYLSNIHCTDLVIDRATRVTGMVDIDTNVTCTANATNVSLFGFAGSYSNSGGATCKFNNSSTGF